MPEFTIKVGHSLDLLRATPDETYHCIVTSPPYFGLRSYEGVEPVVWGGRVDCLHKWGASGTCRVGRDWDATVGKSKVGRKCDTSTGNLCEKCGAWLGVLGNEPNVEMYVAHMVEFFREVRRVLRRDGTLWLNLGDSFSGSGPSGASYKSKTTLAREGKQTDGNFRISKSLGARGLTYAEKKPIPTPGFKAKDLMLVPHRVAIALQADGWWVRMDNVWSKLNCLPESVEDRPTKSHEYVFLLTRSESYFYDAEAVREKQTGGAHARGKGLTPKTVEKKSNPLIRANNSFCESIGAWHEAPDGNRNLRSVWEMASEPYREAHFATFPSKLPTVCIKAGTSEVGVCRECGAPWRRIVEKYNPGKAETTSLYPDGSSARSIRRRQQALRKEGQESAPPPQTVGWIMTCKCPYTPPVPALVHDPFSGAGTTGLAALRLGRNYVGHEASPKYAEMSRRRLRRATLPVQRQEETPAVESEEQPERAEVVIVPIQEGLFLDQM